MRPSCRANDSGMDEKHDVLYGDANVSLIQTPSQFDGERIGEARSSAASCVSAARTAKAMSGKMCSPEDNPVVWMYKLNVR